MKIELRTIMVRNREQSHAGGNGSILGDREEQAEGTSTPIWACRTQLRRWPG